MKMMTIKWIKYCAVLSLIFVAGCAKNLTNGELFNIFRSEGFETQKTDQGVVVLLPDVYFNFDSDVLNQMAHEKLLTMAKILADPKIGTRRVIVEGHTDSMGSDLYNEELSLRRANVVAEYLVLKGINDSRIVRRGYGSKYPIAPNVNSDGFDNPGGRAKNRRVNVILENLPEVSENP